MSTRPITKTFDGTGADTLVTPRGTFFRVLTSTADLTIIARRHGEEIGRFESVQQGIAWESANEIGELVPFDALEISSALAQTAKIQVGMGRVFNDAITGNVSATVTKASRLRVSWANVTGTAQLIVPPDTGRRSVKIKNLSMSERVFISEDAVTPTTGAAYPLMPGESERFETTDGINALTEGSTVALRMIEEVD